MLFVIHATDKNDGIATRAKFYRAHRVHLDQAERYDVDVVTAGTLIADDGRRQWALSSSSTPRTARPQRRSPAVIPTTSTESGGRFKSTATVRSAARQFPRDEILSITQKHLTRIQLPECLTGGNGGIPWWPLK
jgi:uncharacterized protein YciI